MSTPAEPTETFLTIPQKNVVFEGKSIYLTGQSFFRCTFRKCNLIIKDATLLGIFQECSFSDCVWHLNMTVSDSRAWQQFLQHVVPAITQVLPQPKT